MSNVNQLDKETEKLEPTFEDYMNKYEFHNNVIQFHVMMAKRIAQIIKDEHIEEAKESEYFDESFFKAD